MNRKVDFGTNFCGTVFSRISRQRSVLTAISKVLLAILLLVVQPQRGNAVPWSLFVVDENGKALQAQVRTNRSTNGDIQKFETDAAGHLAGDAKPNQGGNLGNVFIFAAGHAPAGGLLHSGQNRVKLGAPHTLAGRVVDDNGKPLPNIAVQLTDIAPGEVTEENPTLENTVRFSLFPSELQLFTTRTDAAGRYVLSNLPGQGSASVVVGDALWQRVAVPVDLSGEGDAPDLKTRLAARLNGRVLGADGKPLVGKTVVGTGNNLTVSTETDATGRYVLGGLAAGKIRIDVRETPQNESGMPPVTETVGVIGAETSVPDIRLEGGAFVEIKAVPAVSDGRFALRREGVPTNQNVLFLEPDEGVMRARVQPGVYHLQIWQPPTGWNEPVDWPTNDWPAGGLEIKAVEGQAATAEIRFAPALILNGIVRDEAGKALPGVPIRGYWDYAATTDAEGCFHLSGFKTGQPFITIGLEWDIVKLENVMLPSTQPLVVTLKKATLVPLRGRVIDDKGSPVANALVTVDMAGTEIPGMVGYMRDYDSKQAKTGADGRYEISGVHFESVVTIKARKTKYRYASGGAVTSMNTILGVNGEQVPNPHPVFSVADIVLQPVGREATGRVVDMEGKPVANVLVAALFGGQDEYGRANNITRTGADGRFAFSELPMGALAFVAGKGEGFGELRSKESALGDLVLHPQTLAIRDLLLAREIATKIANDAPGGEFAPQILAPYDFQTARTIANATQPDGKASPDILRFLAETWINYAPDEARKGLPPLLPEFKSDASSTSFVSFLSDVSRLVPQPYLETLPGEAADAAALRSWVRGGFAQSREALAKLDIEGSADRQTAVRFAVTAALANCLGDAKAIQWGRAALQIAARYDAAHPQQAYGTSQVVQELVKGGAAPLEKNLDVIPPAQRTAMLYSTISVLAHINMEEAQRLLELLPAQPKATTINADWAFDASAIAIITRMKAEDAAAALSLARHVMTSSERAKALALAARLQPQAGAAALWREAFDLANEASQRAQASIIAGMALETDPAVGEELLAKTEDDFFGPNGGNPLSVPIFYIAQSQPGRARVWAEWKWVRVRNAAPNRNDPRTLADIAVAMSAIDTPRALEMADSIPTPDTEAGGRDFSPRQEARFRIAQFLAAPESDRRHFVPQYWNSGDVWEPDLGIQ